MKKIKEKCLGVWMDKTTWEKMSLAARIEGLTRGEWIRQLIQSELEKQEEKIKKMKALLNE